MDITPRATFRSGLGSAAIPGRGDPLARGMAWLGAFVATGAALAVGAVLAVFAAAAVALIAVTAGVLVFLTGLAFRARRVVYARSPVLEARKVGHAWVTYGWDRSAP
jgi:hypothetical protein